MTDETILPTVTFADTMPRLLHDLASGTPSGERNMAERIRRRQMFRELGIPEHDLPPLIDQYGRILP